MREFGQPHPGILKDQMDEVPEASGDSARAYDVETNSRPKTAEEMCRFAEIKGTSYNSLKMAVKSAFPETYERGSRKVDSVILEDISALERKEEQNLRDTEKRTHIRKQLHTLKFMRQNGTNTLDQFEKYKRVNQLWEVVTFLKQGEVDTENTEEDLRKQLSGKKILVLGDDVGSLSAMLNHFGATAYGLEGWDIMLSLAEMGTFAEGHSPQNQVYGGRVEDLYKNSDNKTLKIFEDLGPFDLIFSSSVFNTGSGIQSSMLNSANNLPNYLLNCRQKLLKKGGWNLHMHVDSGLGMEPPHAYDMAGNISANKVYLGNEKNRIRAFRSDSVIKAPNGEIVWDQN